MSRVIAEVTPTVLQAFADAWNRHDIDALMSFMTDDCVFEASAGPEVGGTRYVGREAVRAGYAEVWATFPDAHWSNARHFVHGERGVSEWTFTGTRADGTRVEVNGCDVFTFRDGKIAVKNSYRKNRPALPARRALDGLETDTQAIADHWGKGDVYALIVSALNKMSKPLDGLTVEDLAPVDHFHARGFPATIELADRLPIKAGQHVLDIGCGLGGPARYLAKRFQCQVTGLDITKPFVEAANRLTALLRMQGQVKIELGDGVRLPYADGTFDGAYTQHVTMNIGDRRTFFAQAYRVLKSGGFFALTEHGLGEKGNPHYPLPWSMDGSGAYLVTPSETRAYLERAGFLDIRIEDTGSKYAAAYKTVIEKAQKGELPPLGIHLLMGETAPQKTRNALRNIEEGRTHPIQVICRKPG